MPLATALPGLVVVPPQGWLPPSLQAEELVAPGRCWGRKRLPRGTGDLEQDWGAGPGALGEGGLGAVWVIAAWGLQNPFILPSSPAKAGVRSPRTELSVPAPWGILERG